MKRLVIKIADTALELHINFERTCRICRDFVVEEMPCFCIECSYDKYDIEKERFEQTYNMEAPGDIQLEIFSLLHQIADEMISYDAILIHGAALSYENEAYIFSAPSGTGKTTHILKWLDVLPDSFVINGDKPFVKFSEDDDIAPLACGSPWAGKENMYTNIMVPLKAIIFMERAEDNYIEELSFSQAFLFLLQQTYMPEDEEKMRKTLWLLQRLNGKVKFYKFFCNNFKDDCFDVAFNKLAGNKQFEK